MKIKIPKGNVLLKETPLPYDDVAVMLENLHHHGFNGYVKVQKDGSQFLLFLREGILSTVIQITGEDASLSQEALLRHRIRQGESVVSSFIFSPEMVNVLASSFAFHEVYVHYQIRKREFRKVLGSLDNEKQTAVLELQTEEEPFYLLLNQGRLVTDNFLDQYGQVVAGHDAVNALIEMIETKGSVLNACGERAEEIERKRRLAEEDLGRMKEVGVVVEPGGILKGGAVVKVDEAVVREWQRYRNVDRIEILLPSGRAEQSKIVAKRNIGAKLLVTPAMAKKLSIEKDDTVIIRPLFG